MIKASELRIGNLLSYKGEPILIKMISPNTIYFNEGQQSINAVDPLLISEEWLMRFGFERTTEGRVNRWAFDIGNKHIAPHGDNKYELSSFAIDGKSAFFCDYTVNNYWAAKKCHYVHQMQNLHFAITGEELTLKEPI